MRAHTHSKLKLRVVSGMMVLFFTLIDYDQTLVGTLIHSCRQLSCKDPGGLLVIMCGGGGVAIPLW